MFLCYLQKVQEVVKMVILDGVDYDDQRWPKVVVRQGPIK